jgi:hypothetical protein
MTGEDPGIAGGGLVGHDFDGVEQITKAGLGDLAFLVEQIAFGNDDDAVVRGEHFDSSAGVGEQINGVFQHIAPGGDDLGDDGGGDFRIGHFDGGFDHGQDKALHAVAIVPKVAALGGEQAVVQGGRIGVIGEQFGDRLWVSWKNVSLCQSVSSASKPIVVMGRVISATCAARPFRQAKIRYIAIEPAMP